MDDATQPEGVQSKPTKAQTDEFVSKCRSLNMWLMSTLLDAKLVPSLPNNTRMKALWLIESILRRKIENVEMCEDYFAENRSNLEAAADSVMIFWKFYYGLAYHRVCTSRRPRKLCRTKQGKFLPCLGVETTLDQSNKILKFHIRR